jgi:hypothetical protein
VYAKEACGDGPADGAHGSVAGCPHDDDVVSHLFFVFLIVLCCTD